MNRALFWLSAAMVFLFAGAALYLNAHGVQCWEAVAMGAFFTWRAYFHAKVAARR